MAMAAVHVDRAASSAVLRALAAVALLAGMSVSDAAAQVVSASARDAALAGNGTMLTRGARALGVNPALLAAPDRPSFSIALPTIAAGATSAPLRFSEITPYEHAVVPRAVAESWLQRITAAGGLRATADAAFDALGVSVGPFALGVSGTGEAALTLPPELTELLLFGNAGRTGEPHDMTFTGGGGRTWGAGMLSVGYARRLPLRGSGNARESFSVGIAAKYVVSPYMATMIAPRGRVVAEPVESDLTVPLVIFDEGRRGGMGATGYGIDLGGAWTIGPLALGLTVHDAVNTFRYRITSARVYTTTALVSEGSTRARTSHGMMLDDPAVSDTIRARARELVRDARFPPTVRVSSAYALTSWLTVTSDALAHAGSADALTLLPQFSVGLGAEARILSFLPLRAGVRVGGGASTFHAGAGLRLFALRLDGAIGTTRGVGGGLAGALGVTVMGGRF
jgi:hypothetical protein